MSSDYAELSSFHSQKEVHFQSSEEKDMNLLHPLAQELILNLIKFGTSCSPTISPFLVSPYFSLLPSLISPLDPSERMTLDQVIHHPYITDNDTIDPLTLHTNPAIPLPQTNHGNGSRGEGPHEDKEWARRQCSIVWAPMPMNYDFSTTSTNIQISGGRNKALDGAIEELEIEYQVKF